MKYSNINLVYIKKDNTNKVSLIIGINNFLTQRLDLITIKLKIKLLIRLYISTL